MQSVTHSLVYREDRDIDTVLAGKISQRNFPTSEDKANWIISNFRVRAENVLKGAPRFKQGDELLVQDDGGTVMVRGVEVVAVGLNRPLVSGKRYLFFGNITDDGRLLRTATLEEPVPGGLLVNIRPQGNERLEKMSLNRALDHLRKEMRKR